MLEIKELLTPISDDEPCGPDLEYDAAFGEMERAAQGKEDQQFGDTVVACNASDSAGNVATCGFLVEGSLGGTCGRGKQVHISKKKRARFI